MVNTAIHLRARFFPRLAGENVVVPKRRLEARRPLIGHWAESQCPSGSRLISRIRYDLRDIPQRRSAPAARARGTWRGCERRSGLPAARAIQRPLPRRQARSGRGAALGSPPRCVPRAARLAAWGKRPLGPGCPRRARRRAPAACRRGGGGALGAADAHSAAACLCARGNSTVRLFFFPCPHAARPGGGAAARATLPRLGHAQCSAPPAPVPRIPTLTVIETPYRRLLARRFLSAAKTAILTGR